MAGDMVVALGRTTADGRTHFAHNSDRPAGECSTLRRVAGREHAPGEKVHTQFLDIPQARQTFTVVGSQPAGFWGFCHGINEHGLALGRTGLRAKITCTGPGLTGTDLVRLALERARTARQAVDLIADLLERFGQGVGREGPPEIELGSALLAADAREALLVESAGRHWVCREVAEFQAVSDVSRVGQDWGRISRGLAGQAIEQGWWPADGTKMDFAAALIEEPAGQCSALRRWGRATSLLEQQAGHIDVPFLRRLLADHYEGLRSEVDPFWTKRGPVPLCQHETGESRPSTAGSLIAPLATDRVLPAWSAFGPPCVSFYFPVFVAGELPAMLTGAGPNDLWHRLFRLREELRRQPDWRSAVTEAFDRLQAQLDQDAEEFATEATKLKTNAPADLARQASLFMEHCRERVTAVMEGLAEHLNVLRGSSERETAKR